MQSEIRHRERRAGRGGMTGGLILIVLGIVFLAQQYAWFSLHNWWALFILIPALGNFGTAWALYRRAGQFTQAVRGSLFGGLIILAVALMFLLDLDWSAYWPVFLILPGLGMFLAGLPLAGAEHPAGIFAGPWMAGTGLGALLLGLGFLGQNLDWIDPAALAARWWALPIFLPALGGLIATLRITSRNGPRAAALSSLAAALTVAVVAVVALLGVNWNLLWPLALIAAGIIVLLGVLGSQRS